MGEPLIDMNILKQYTENAHVSNHDNMYIV